MPRPPGRRTAEASSAARETARRSRHNAAAAPRQRPWPPSSFPHRRLPRSALAMAERARRQTPTAGLAPGRESPCPCSRRSHAASARTTVAHRSPRSQVTAVLPARRCVDPGADRHELGARSLRPACQPRRVGSQHRVHAGLRLRHRAARDQEMGERHPTVGAAIRRSSGGYVAGTAPRGVAGDTGARGHSDRWASPQLAALPGVLARQDPPLVHTARYPALAAAVVVARG